MKRRNFLALVGGGIILAAGGTAGVVATRFPDKALQPWSDAGVKYTEPRMRALSHAILAPNPHNRQPWLVNLSNKNQIILTVDTNKLLPHTDPFGRQITIGLGCFLEVLRMAAADDGYRAEFDLFPEGSDQQKLDERPIAIITMNKDGSVKPDPLFAHVQERRSLKEPYDLGQIIPSDTLRNIEAVSQNQTRIAANNDVADVQTMRDLTHEAIKIEIETPRTYKESVDLFRIGKTEIEANPDGIDFSGPFFEMLNFTGLMTREDTLDPQSTNYSEGLKAVFAQTDTAMAHVWLVTPGNSRIDQINAGRDWVRINLATTQEGVGIQPLSQLLQEYEEMKTLYDQVHTMLAPEGGTLQMLARLGYAERTAPSPRWPLEAKIIEA